MNARHRNVIGNGMKPCEHELESTIRLSESACLTSLPPGSGLAR